MDFFSVTPIVVVIDDCFFDKLVVITVDADEFMGFDFIFEQHFDLIRFLQIVQRLIAKEWLCNLQFHIYRKWDDARNVDFRSGEFHVQFSTSKSNSSERNSLINSSESTLKWKTRSD